MDKTSEKPLRNISQGVKYKITPQLSHFLKELRLEMGATSERFAELLGKKPNTYNNIENKVTNNITYDTLMDIFRIVKDNTGHEDTPLDSFVLNKTREFAAKHSGNDIWKQSWMFALILEKQRMAIKTNGYDFKQIIFDDTNVDMSDTSLDDENYNLIKWKKIVARLNENKHIKKKDKYTISNQVYISEEKVGKYYYWVLKFELNEDTINNIANDIYKDNITTFAVLFTMLFNMLSEKYKERDQMDIFIQTYDYLDFSKIYHIFKEIEVGENNFKNQLKSNLANELLLATPSQAILRLAESFDLGNTDYAIEMFCKNCLNGKDDFFYVIAADLEDIFKDSSKKESFRKKYQSLVKEYSE